MPRVFYGKEPEVSRSIASGEISGTGSEAETDVEPGVRLKRGLHKRSETVTVGDGVAKKRKSGTKGSSRDASGRAPLQRACVKGSFERVKELLDAGADPEDRDYAGTTALHSAALQGDVSIVRALLDAGAQADARSGPEEQDTPLMDAAAHGQAGVVELLLSRGADARITNTDGRTALDFALDFGDDEEEIAPVVSMLRNNIAEARRSGKPPPPPPVSQSLSAAAAQSPLPDVTTRSGRAEVARRAAQGDMTSVGLALEQGWQPTAEALVMAAKFGHHEVVGLLLAFGLSPDEEYEGETALHATLGRGHVQTVKLLLDSGASRKWKDQRGRTYMALVADFPVDDPERIILDPTVATIARETETATSSSQAARSQTDGPAVKKEDSGERPVSDVEPHKSKSEKVSSPEPIEPERPEKLGESKEKNTQSHVEALHVERTREHKNMNKRSAPRSGDTPHQANDDSSISPRHMSPGAPKQQAPVMSTGAATRMKAGFKPRERETVHVLPAAPPPDPAQILALEELARRKERERHQREAKMLEALAKRQREPVPSQSDLTASPTLPTEPESKEAVETPELTTDLSKATSSTVPPNPIEVESDSFTNTPPEPRESAHRGSSSIAGLPRALRDLASHPTPNASALPLLIYTDSSSRWVLDVQAAVALGKPRLHAEHPDWTKQAIPEPLKQTLWNLAQSWLGQPASEHERELFMALPVAFVRLSDVVPLFADTPPVVDIEPALPQARLADCISQASRLPFRLSMKLQAQRQQYRW